MARTLPAEPAPGTNLFGALSLPAQREGQHYGGDEALNARSHQGRDPTLNAPQMSRPNRMILDRNLPERNFMFALGICATVRE